MILSSCPWAVSLTPQLNTLFCIPLFIMKELDNQSNYLSYLISEICSIFLKIFENHQLDDTYQVIIVKIKMQPFALLILIFLPLALVNAIQQQLNSIQTQDKATSINQAFHPDDSLQQGNSMIKAQQVGQQLVKLNEIVDNVKKDVKIVTDKYSEETVQNQYKEFGIKIILTILQPIFVILLIVVLVALLLCLIYMYLTKWRHQIHQHKKLTKGHQIHIESEHSSSTNLEDNSNRVLEPTI